MECTVHLNWNLWESIEVCDSASEKVTCVHIAICL